MELPADERGVYFALRMRLASLLHAYQVVVPGALDPAVPGSRYAAARESGLFDPYEQAGLMLFSAEDHLRTIGIVLHARLLPPLGLYSLLRPAGEAIARCRYLLEPDIDETTRLARGLNERLNNIRERDKMLPEANLLAARSPVLVARADANSIPVISGKNGQLSGFAAVRPQLIDLFIACFDEGELIYRVLSAHVHSMPWSILHSGQTRTSAEPGFSMRTLSVDLKFFANLLSELLARHEQNIVRILELAGYPAAVWTAAVESGVRTARAELERETDVARGDVRERPRLDDAPSAKERNP